MIPMGLHDRGLREKQETLIPLALNFLMLQRNYLLMGKEGEKGGKKKETEGLHRGPRNHSSILGS